MNSSVTINARVALANGKRRPRSSSPPTFVHASPRYCAPGPFPMRREGEALAEPNGTAGYRLSLGIDDSPSKQAAEGEPELDGRSIGLGRDLHAHPF